MGAWIEIKSVGLKSQCLIVAPFMGAWIEILPVISAAIEWVVAPFMGAWIEIKEFHQAISRA